MKKFLVVVMVSIAVVFSGQSALAKTEKGLRVSLGVVPGMDQVEFDNAGAITTFDLDAESGVNINPAFVFRTSIEKPVGFVGAFGLFIRSHTGSDIIGDEVELTAFGASAAPGLAINISKKIHLELKAEFCLGRANQSLPGATDGSGPYFSLGANVGGYFKLGKTFVLGGEVGYIDFTSIGELNSGGTIVDTEFTGAGPIANVSLGWMF